MILKNTSLLWNTVLQNKIKTFTSPFLITIRQVFSFVFIRFFLHLHTSMCDPNIRMYVWFHFLRLAGADVSSLSVAHRPSHAPFCCCQPQLAGFSCQISARNKSRRVKHQHWGINIIGWSRYALFLTVFELDSLNQANVNRLKQRLIETLALSWERERERNR